MCGWNSEFDDNSILKPETPFYWMGFPVFRVFLENSQHRCSTFIRKNFHKIWLMAFILKRLDFALKCNYCLLAWLLNKLNIKCATKCPNLKKMAARKSPAPSRIHDLIWTLYSDCKHINLQQNLQEKFFSERVIFSVRQEDRFLLKCLKCSKLRKSCELEPCE